MAHGQGGDTFVASMESGKLVTVFPKGFGTGNAYITGFTENNLVVFSVTPTGTAWAGGYDMWNTLTVTGKQMFVNAVVASFIE